jgi:glycosyltransferase involved in cell wall biosynthesis
VTEHSFGASFFDPAKRRSLGGEHLRSLWFRALRTLVWRRLPRPLRQRTFHLLFSANRAPVAIGAAAARPICVVGLLSTPTGIGEGGRLCGRALAALGYDVRSVDISEILQGTTPSPAPPPPLEPGRGTVLLHFNPDNLGSILTLLGRRRLRGKRIIGYWAWELPRIPDHWIDAFREVDEIWTPSRFVAGAIEPFTDKPVRVVPHPVGQASSGTDLRGVSGGRRPFTVLVMFSFASSFVRKNPVGAVHAFRRAFGEDAAHELVIKVSDAAESPDEMAELLAAISGAPNIRIQERRLDDRERLDLIAGADAFLSLHRAEGFGLVLAEAMMAGVAVIATAWSGNMDFMDEDSALLVPATLITAKDGRNVYSYGECWADPDVDVAAEHLRGLAADPERFAEMRHTARRRVSESLGLQAFAEAVEPALGPVRQSRRPAAPAWLSGTQQAGLQHG